MFMSKILKKMAMQIRKPSVKLPQNTKPHKITDDNQSIHYGVINEKLDADLRSQSEFGRKRK